MGIKVGFVSQRFAGADDVSLESAKWAQVLWDHRHVSYWYSGMSDRDEDASMVVPHAYAGHPDIEWIDRRLWGTSTRTPDVTQRVYALADYLKGTLYEFTKRFDVDLLVVENVFSNPSNVPLGVALCHFISETGFPTIARHHDLYWDIPDYEVTAGSDLLGMMTADLPCVLHVTVSSRAQRVLAARTALASTVVPYVMDFENEPASADEYAVSFRSEIGAELDDVLILHPSPIAARKGIERTIEMAARLKQPMCKVLATGPVSDLDYLQRLKDLAAWEGLDFLAIGDRVGSRRQMDENKKIFSLEDVFSQVNLVSIPSEYESFSSSLLLALYSRIPILVNRYASFISDIEPKGLKVVAIDGLITQDVVKKVNQLLQDREYRKEFVDFNYEIGKAFFSYSVLFRRLRTLVTNFTGGDDL